MGKDVDVTLDLSAGSVARLMYLVKQYGSIESVIESAIDLLSKQETNPLLSAGARERLNKLSDRYQSTEEAVIEIALEHLLNTNLRGLNQLSIKLGHWGSLWDRGKEYKYE